MASDYRDLAIGFVLGVGVNVALAGATIVENGILTLMMATFGFFAFWHLEKSKGAVRPFPFRSIAITSAMALLIDVGLPLLMMG